MSPWIRRVVLVGAVAVAVFYVFPKAPHDRTIEWDTSGASGLRELTARIDDANGETIREARFNATLLRERAKQTVSVPDGSYRAYVRCTGASEDRWSEHRLELGSGVDRLRVQVCHN